MCWTLTWCRLTSDIFHLVQHRHFPIISFLSIPALDMPSWILNWNQHWFSGLMVIGKSGNMPGHDVANFLRAIFYCCWWKERIKLINCRPYMQWKAKAVQWCTITTAARGVQETAWHSGREESSRGSWSDCLILSHKATPWDRHTCCR